MRLFRHPHYPHVLLGGLAAVWLALAIGPPDRAGWLLENLLVFAFVPLLVFTFQCQAGSGKPIVGCVFLHERSSSPISQV